VAQDRQHRGNQDRDEGVVEVPRGQLDGEGGGSQHQPAAAARLKRFLHPAQDGRDPGAGDVVPLDAEMREHIAVSKGEASEQASAQTGAAEAKVVVQEPEQQHQMQQQREAVSGAHVEQTVQEQVRRIEDAGLALRDRVDSEAQVWIPQREASGLELVMQKRVQRHEVPVRVHADQPISVRGRPAEHVSRGERRRPAHERFFHPLHRSR
jgi:hypothetical protein